MRLLLLTAILIFGCPLGQAAPLATAQVGTMNAGEPLVADGVVEAVRQTDISAQVQGRITALLVKAGDQVKSGQILARIDERVSQQQTLTGRSQVAALAAQLDAASREYQRKQQLFKQGFLSQASLEKAESEFKISQAQTKAQMAQVDSSVVQTGLHLLVAPYAGVISKVNIELGGMASPGKPLITLYDPAAMRIAVNVPQSRLSDLAANDATGTVLEIPAAPASNAAIQSLSMTVLPSTDEVSQTVVVRFDLPSKLAGMVPGMFARAHIRTRSGSQASRLIVPSRAVFRRSELTAVYVLDGSGKPLLRLVRVGRMDAGQTEILAGLEAGEKVVLDPLSAATGTK